MALEELQWLPTDLFLLQERLTPLANLCKGGSKQWQALCRAAVGAMETLLEDLRWVCEASTTLRKLPDSSMPGAQGRRNLKVQGT